MSSIGSPSPFFFGGKKEAYAVERSLRFNHGDSPYLSFTPSSTGNQKVWTFSAWIKKTAVTNDRHYIYSANDSNSAYFALYFDNDELYTYFDPGNNYGSVSGRKFRDLGAWFHIVHQVDAANTTQRIWINGTEMSLNSSRNPGNNNYPINQASKPIVIGKHSWGSDYYIDMYLAEVHYSDGNKYEPSDFAETNAITGQWIPKSPSITYGTNGFYLNFSDTSSLGADSSGNSNNFTPNNFSTSAGEGNDSVLDTPTTNYCTLNSLDKAAAITLKNGNLQVDNSTTGNYDGFRATFGSKTGKYYWEIKFPSTGYMDAIGIARADGRIDTGNQPTYRIVLGLGSWYNSYNSGGVATYVNATPSGDYPSVATWSGASNYSSNDIYMIAVDFGAGKIWWGKNNSWFNNSGTANPATGTDPRITFTTGNEWFPYSQSGDSSTSPQAYNFGQQGFAYTPPSGFVALNSANLPDPTILLPDKHFDTKLYVGNGSTGQTITYEFQPDFVWMKNRSGSNNHAAVNTVVGRAKGLYPDSTSAEFNSAAGRDVSAFTSNGFTVGEPEQASSTNNNGSNIVAWAWNAGDSDGKTYTVKVHDFSGNNRYIFDDFQTQAVTLDLAEGGTYIFNMDDASNASHPFSIGTAANGTVYTDASVTYFLDGVSKTYSEYTSGFAAATTRRLHITSLPASAPVLYYWCSAHSGMGGQINTNSTLGSSNFDGAIKSTVKANTTSGFSIVAYTGNGVNDTDITIGHGLGVTPDVVIIKAREGTSSSQWIFWHKDLSSHGSYTTNLLFLNTTSAENYYSDQFKSAQATTFTIRTEEAGNGRVNQNGIDYLSLCFSEVAGYSKFGVYNGNSSDNGPFVYTGFSVSWLLVKRRDGTTNWCILDNKRDPDNVANTRLFPNSSSADSVSSGNVSAVDFLSNGFKVRDSHQDGNSSSGEYIYLAFAESPFKNARAR